MKEEMRNEISEISKSIGRLLELLGEDEEDTVKVIQSINSLGKGRRKSLGNTITTYVPVTQENRGIGKKVEEYIKTNLGTKYNYISKNRRNEVISAHTLEPIMVNRAFVTPDFEESYSLDVGGAIYELDIKSGEVLYLDEGKIYSIGRIQFFQPL